MFSYFLSQKRVSGYLRLYVPALVQLGSLQQQDRYIPPFFFPPFQELVFRGRSEEDEGDGDDMTRAQIFLGPFGCGPKIGGDRAKVGERRLAGRVMRMRAGIGSILRW